MKPCHHEPYILTEKVDWKYYKKIIIHKLIKAWGGGGSVEKGDDKLVQF